MTHTRSNEMAAPPVGSILIGSSNVDAAKQWYRDAFGVTENDNGAFEFGTLGLFVEEHSEVSGPTKEPSRVIINLDVDDSLHLQSHLHRLGVPWVSKVTPEALRLTRP